MIYHDCHVMLTFNSKQSSVVTKILAIHVNVSFLTSIILMVVDVLEGYGALIASVAETLLS